MRRDEDTTPEDLNRPEGNDLESNYEAHDTGEEALVHRLREYGFDVVEWGIDQREDDGSDGIIYDDKMDLKVVDEDGQLCGLVDVKTKRNPSFMGRFNERHFDHYYEHAEDFDCPVFVVMFQVSDSRVVDELVLDVEMGESAVHRSSESDAVPNFPDGNNAVLVMHDYREDFHYMVRALDYQRKHNENND